MKSMLLLAMTVLISSDKDWNECVEKYNSAWGEKCSQCMYSKDTYQVWLRNKCDETVDVQCCVQEEDKRWKCFKVMEMSPQDTMISYACKGTGKFLYWVRKTGDKSTEFPGAQEVNSKYFK